MAAPNNNKDLVFIDPETGRLPVTHAPVPVSMNTEMAQVPVQTTFANGTGNYGNGAAPAY